MNQERGLVVTSVHQASQAVTRPLDQQPWEDLPCWANHLQGAPLTTFLTTQLDNCYYLIRRSETEQDFSQVITPRELKFEMKRLTLKCIFPVLCVCCATQAEFELTILLVSNFCLSLGLRVNFNFIYYLFKLNAFSGDVNTWLMLFFF